MSFTRQSEFRDNSIFSNYKNGSKYQILIQLIKLGKMFFNDFHSTTSKDFFASIVDFSVYECHLIT